MKKTEGLFRVKPNENNRRGKWRVTIDRFGRKFDACFSESMYDNPADARAAAECFLNELQKILPPRHTFNRIGADGLPGSVSFVNNRWPHYRAMLTVDRQRRKKIYTIAKFGQEEAMQLAQETRMRWLREAGYFRQSTLPTLEEVELLVVKIRHRFNERSVPRSIWNSGAVPEAGLTGHIRRYERPGLTRGKLPAEMGK